jgi:hypothetical protein
MVNLGVVGKEGSLDAMQWNPGQGVEQNPGYVTTRLNEASRY